MFQSTLQSVQDEERGNEEMFEMNDAASSALVPEYVVTNDHIDAPTDITVTPFEGYVVPEATPLPDDLEAEVGPAPPIFDGVRIDINEDDAMPGWKRRCIPILIGTAAMDGTIDFDG